MTSDRSRWRYVAGDDAQDQMHVVIAIDDGIITTWSLPEPDIDGHCWRGDGDAFKASFLRVA